MSAIIPKISSHNYVFRPIYDIPLEMLLICDALLLNLCIISGGYRVLNGIKINYIAGS